MGNIKQAVLFMVIMAVSTTVSAVPFINGDFGSSGNGWSDASATGSIIYTGGVAQLDTGMGDDPYSTILVQGDDGYFNFDAPISLSSSDAFLNFDVSFLSLGLDASESGASAFGDYLSIAIYDALDASFDTVLTSIIDGSIGSGFVRFNFDVSALIGREIALSFELSDQDDGYNSRVLLDNISFSSVALPGGDIIPIPEPDTLLLFVLGIVLLISRTKFKQIQAQYVRNSLNGAAVLTLGLD